MKKAILSLLMVLFAATGAFATGGAGGFDAASVTVDGQAALTVGATVVTALAGLWGLRKVIKLVNRS